MYTNSLESERKFLTDLLQSHCAAMHDDARVFVRKCPKCRIGFVTTKCVRDVKSTNAIWQFHHACDTCGEVFVIGKMQSDIFFHTPFALRDQLETPLGTITVRVNGNPVQFRYRTNAYENPQAAKPITLKRIDIDLSTCQVGDRIACDFDRDLLLPDDSDERSVLRTCENPALLLGLCAYAPYEWDLGEHCYRLETQNGKGFCYQIVSKPNKFDANDFYHSSIATLAVAWINKADFSDPNLELFLALTAVIG